MLSSCGPHYTIWRSSLVSDNCTFSRTLTMRTDGRASKRSYCFRGWKHLNRKPRWVGGVELCSEFELKRGKNWNWKLKLPPRIKAKKLNQKGSLALIIILHGLQIKFRKFEFSSILIRKQLRKQKMSALNIERAGKESGLSGARGYFSSDSTGWAQMLGRTSQMEPWKRATICLIRNTNALSNSGRIGVCGRVSFKSK